MAIFTYPWIMYSGLTGFDGLSLHAKMFRVGSEVWRRIGKQLVSINPRQMESIKFRHTVLYSSDPPISRLPCRACNLWLATLRPHNVSVSVVINEDLVEALSFFQQAVTLTAPTFEYNLTMVLQSSSKLNCMKRDFRCSSSPLCIDMKVGCCHVSKGYV